MKTRIMKPPESNVSRFEILLRKFRNHKKRIHRIRDAKKKYKRSNLLKDYDKDYVQEVQSYWKKHFGRKISPVWHIAIANATGEKDVRFVPHDVWIEHIIPHFNRLDMRSAFMDKNLSDTFLNYPKSPVIIVKKMHGRFYGYDNIEITAKEAKKRIIENGKDKIIKPSQTDNAFGIQQLLYDRGFYLSGEKTEFEDIDLFYGDNYVIQERFEQHHILSDIHPHSLNTIRMSSLRWKDSIFVLDSVVRVGNNGSICDNIAKGGLFWGIDKKGFLKDYAVNGSGLIYYKHPFTGVSFGGNKQIPNFDQFEKFVINEHKKIYHFDLINWDIVISKKGEPVFLEMNFRGSSERQFATKKPYLREYTEEILEEIRDINKRQ